MKRRKFIAATAALLVSPWRSRAQGTRRRLGVLTIGERPPTMARPHSLTACETMAGSMDET